MKLRKTICAVISAAVLVAMLCISAMASDVYNKPIYLAANQQWTAADSVTRSGLCNDVGARCNSVYPVAGGTDNYTMIQCRIVSESGTVVMNGSFVRLNEANTNYYTYIPIKNGYLNLSTVCFQFRGNSSDAVRAVVSYTGR